MQFVVLVLLEALLSLVIYPIMYAVSTPFILVLALRSPNYNEGVRAGYERVKSICDSLWWV